MIRSSHDFRQVLKSSVSFGRVAGMGALLALPLFASPALANPSSAAVTTGSASIASVSNKTTIDQKSEDVVINWSSFNVGAGQTTQFVQPNAQAIAVNRIGGNSASQILGTLDANGRIVLINGNGMLFGKGSQVNVGSLVATSTGGADSDVLAGKFTQAGNQNAAIVNQGIIRASQGGLVALVAPSVTNAGMVNAKFGTVAVGAANKFTVDFTGDGLVSFAAQGDVNGKASAVNTGSLVGANVSLTAHAAEGVATGVVSMSGFMTAQTAKNVGGTILLDAGDGSLTSTGAINAAGATGGGNIETSGAQVAVTGKVTAGQGGNWKTDPDNLTIYAPAAHTISFALNQGTSVWEETSSTTSTGSGTSSPGNGDIVIDAPITWNTGAMLYLYSYHSIDFNANLNVKNGGCLTFEINNGGTGGVMSFADGGHINIDTDGTSFTLNGVGYDVVDDISTLASDIASDPSGNFVLGLSYSAKADGTYTSSPIATTFTGTFYGLGNAITHLDISESGSSAGLFADIGSGGLVSGLGVEGDIVGARGADTGALAGILSGSLYDDYSKGRVKETQEHHGEAAASIGGLVGIVESGGSVNDSYSTAKMQGNSLSAIGGLIGTDDSTGSADYDYATGSVTVMSHSSSSDVGGLIGAAYGTEAEYDFATGAVSGGINSNMGGLIGLASDMSLSQAYSTGSVSGGARSKIGGLIGSQTGGTDSTLYWDVTTSGVSQGVGNISNAPGVSGLTTTQLQSGLPSGFDASVWGSDSSINGGLPYLLANPPA